jgi:glycerophosphoryl diester phosphodiesterase
MGCSKKRDFSMVDIIGHGGNGLEILNSFYHDNSLEAIGLAASIEGTDGIEVDVQISADGNLWLYHDDFLESESSGEGCINEKKSDYLSQIHYKTLVKEKLSKLSEINSKYLEGKKLFLDLRHYNFCENDFVSIEEMLAGLKNLEILHNPKITVYCILSTKQWIGKFLNQGFNVLVTLGEVQQFEDLNMLYPEIAGIVVNNNKVTAQNVSSIQNLGKKVYIFEVRSPKGIRKALNKLPDGIITDDIRTALIEKY